MPLIFVFFIIFAFLTTLHVNFFFLFQFSCSGTILLAVNAELAHQLNEFEDKGTGAPGPDVSLALALTDAETTSDQMERENVDDMK